ncbi:MAG: DNA modification methylase [Candidatus Omnitrophica bacterium]|nr:DNA modification methylase [Candidatus Omnitrophota bacterium]
MSYATALFPDLFDLTDPYFTEQLITYIGNKRSLLPFINKGIEEVKKDLSRSKLVIIDGFAGSGAVSRLLKYHASQLWVNDLEDYSEIINKCYLANRSEVDAGFIESKIAWLNENKLKIPGGKAGFIEKNYAPADSENIKEGERVFYTNRNAKIIDNLKRLINTGIRKEERHFFLAPLIVEASIHTNTSGVFKGFHKRNGTGCFGGRGENALTRIKRDIVLEAPVFSEVECEVHISKSDINSLIKSEELPEDFDLAYYDPPYNQHPYGSNYFMLNIIACERQDIEIQDGVSGISKNWNRSAYNKRNQAEQTLDALIADTPARYILLSYNNEGIIPIGRLKKILGKYGSYNLMTQKYNTYRGSRNLNGRSIKVEELLWVLKKR